jgi:hypothetical protein
MVRFISIVSPDFWPGFAALAQSLVENSGLDREDYELVVICDPAFAPAKWIASRPERISVLPISELPVVPVLSPQSQGRRMEQALQKLAVFALPEQWGTCVYIDSDMVCLNPIEELAAMQPLTAAHDFLSGFDREPTASSEGNADINTGIMVFSPSQATFHNLVSIYSERHAERTDKGDQDIINMWIQETRQSVQRLGSEWNFSKRLQDCVGVRWVKENLKRIKILHFVGVKPWTPNSEINTVRECQYGWMEKIWWEYFERSGFAAHMENPPNRPAVFLRQWILPWTKPAILKEHCVRGARLLRRLIRKRG